MNYENIFVKFCLNCCEHFVIYFSHIFDSNLCVIIYMHFQVLMAAKS